jgi:uncharacterized protein YggE
MSRMGSADSGQGLWAPTVTVRGDAVIRSEPDEAVLSITLNALEDGPGAALSDVSARSNALVALLDDAGVAKADRSTTGVTVAEEFDHTEEGRRSLGHRATARVSVRLRDPQLIGRLMTEATEDLAAQVNGPHWLISFENPARLDAARQAAADAKRKAQAYAEGIGAKVGHPVELSEPNTHVVQRHARAAALSARGPIEPMPVEPGEHEVSASIQATFTLELD